MPPLPRRKRAKSPPPPPPRRGAAADSSNSGSTGSTVGGFQTAYSSSAPYQSLSAPRSTSRFGFEDEPEDGMRSWSGGRGARFEGGGRFF